MIAAPGRKALHYHVSPTCSGLDSYYRSEGYWSLAPTITVADAARRGLTPCHWCSSRDTSRG